MRKFFVITKNFQGLKYLGEVANFRDAIDVADAVYGMGEYETVLSESTVAKWMEEFNKYCKETTEKQP